MYSKVFALSGLATLASGHILMTNPVPFGKASLNNSPLDASGSDFPCKQRPGVYDLAGAGNVYAQGSTQQLSFQGTAVHGGGSCQVSVTTDAKPDKNSVWKVIKSIEGGCPAQGQTGNMGNSADTPVPFKYDFTVPKELSAGNYTLAWTWFNKIGNREMYMNCAPLTVTGSSGSEAFMKGLPDMFVANVGNDCTTPDSKDVQFPNPGKAIERLNGATSAFAMPTAGGCQKPGSGGNDPAPTNAPGGEQQPTAPVSSAPAVSSPTKLPGGVFITTPVSEKQPAITSQPLDSQPAASNSPPVVTPVAPGNPAASTPAVPTPTPGNDTGSTPGGGNSAGTACSDEGAWNCIDGNSFQRCASGMWSAVQPMAAGVSCESGTSSELKMAAKAPSKRTLRRALRVAA